MATSKQKKTVKVRDLKPSKDAKGGIARNAAAQNTALKSNLSKSNSVANKSFLGAGHE